MNEVELPGPVRRDELASAPAKHSDLGRLLAWINSHDCGVEPTAVLRADGAIDIRCTAVATDGKVTVETDVVRTYAQARAVLGY